MIYTLTVNPALDYNVYTEKFTSGEINRGYKSEIFAGGKGINVSTVLTRLGVENTALGFAAGFSGKELLRLLDSENQKHDFVFLKSGATRINVKIREKCETDINMNGVVPKSDETAALCEKIKRIGRGDILCLCGNVPSELGTQFYADICKTVAESGGETVVDATGETLLKTLMFSPLFIKPNIEELCEIYGNGIKTKEDIISCAKDLHKKGAKNVMVTLGGDGAILVTENGEVLIEKGIKGKVVSTVGAGDSAVAGFIAKYRKTDIKDAFHFSMLCGAATAFSSGLCTAEDIEKLL